MSDIAKQLNRAKLISNFSGNTGKKGQKTSVSFLEARVNLLEKYWNEFLGAHSKLMLADDQTHDYYKNDVFNDIQNDYLVTVSSLNDEIIKLKALESGPTLSTTPISPINSNFRRVPNLQLPKFSGKQRDWETFKELFCSIIKDDVNLTPVEKLQHLLNALEGPAASSLKGLKVIGANLKVAWDKLLRRYDNRRIRLSTHLDNLINLKPVSRKSAYEINHLLDTADESIKGLEDLACDVDKFDVWFVHLLTRKLDAETREDWEISQEKCVGFSSYNDLRKFLEARVRSLEQAHTSSSGSSVVPSFKEKSFVNSPKFDNKSKQFKAKSVAIHNMTKSTSNISRNLCKYCSGAHKLRDCDTFKNCSVLERRARVTQLKLCFNCLASDHRASECPSSARCFICEERHHVKLHLNKVENSNSSELVNSNQEETSVHFGSVGTTVLLATARIQICSASGDTVGVRALIDPGAEASFISEKIANILCLPRYTANVSISGVGAHKSGVARTKASIILRSNVYSDFSLSASVLILDKLTADIPGCTLKSIHWSHISNLSLADPEFYKPAKIDCILGADVYGAILMDGVVKSSPSTPIAQETRFGWVLTGPTGADDYDRSKFVQSLHISLEPSLSSILERFWEVENLPPMPILSEEDEYCENLYRSTTYRRPDGRYVVRLPFKERTTYPGSREIALSCLLRTERRLAKHLELHTKYHDFMSDYENLGHMKSVMTIYDKSNCYYIPHHSVFGSSGKLRVVFNASQKCSTGVSLNETLYPGPKLQPELSLVVTRWRFHKYVFVCDAVKMYRQILIADEDLDYQRILWKPDGSEDIVEYQLLTVTYGTTPAPFLAIRTLLQLANDEGDRFPAAAEILRKQAFVDDFLAGEHSLECTLALRNQLIDLLSTAGFSLSKWAANHTGLLEKLPENSESVKPLELSESVSTLGLVWCPSSDWFSFRVTLPSAPSVVTKRGILSEIAKLFDPLGWLGPVLVRGKILLQDLWISAVDWDTSVPTEFQDRWLTIRSDLCSIRDIKIPRWIEGTSCSAWELHGFSDASSRAYAAVLYIKAEGCKPYLVMAKTKVAPIKTLSIPRLELCGALLLARLLKTVLSDLPCAPSQTVCYTDSTVVLAWLSNHPSKWSTFVANRVSEILQAVPNVSWQHISTSENPADCASRGMSAESLRDFQLWWHGPVWLQSGNHSSSDNPELFHTDEEERVSQAIHIVQVGNSILEFLSRFSSLSKIIGIIGYCRRWIRYHRGSQQKQSSLSAEEINDARLTLWRMIQMQYFGDDICSIEASKMLPKTSSLLRLKPFLGDNNVLRLGGRLQNSSLSYNEKHPIILPRKCHFSRLLVEEAHRDTLHGGPQVMMSYLNRFVWIIKGKRLVQSVYKSCLKCVRFGARPLFQQMAPLPYSRINPQRPFAASGLDYAGPFPVRAHKGRGHHSSKGYVAIFVCMVTRAVHLEVISDLTTASFLAGYRRFTSRRGTCSVIYSDNATTFRGAAKELNELFSATSQFCSELSAALAREGTHWSFIPPRAPHFGGLWEAAVRSFKYHLKRVVGDTSLTFEEFSTLSAQIEACLNSRPLCPMSNEPNDLSALTPGHFLIGSALKLPPEPFDEVDLTKSYLSRWKHLLIMRNHFWARWRTEVLYHLQQRNKWLKPSDPITVGDLVIIKDDQFPPTRWPIGRVMNLYPGSDGLVRVADIKTASTQFRRPLVKLVKLPTEPKAAHTLMCMSG